MCKMQNRTQTFNPLKHNYRCTFDSMLCRTELRHSVHYTIESVCVKSRAKLKHSVRFNAITCALLIQCCAAETELKHSVRYTIESGCVKSKTELKQSIRFNMGTFDSMLYRTELKHSVRYTIESGCVKTKTELKHSIRFSTIT